MTKTVNIRQIVMEMLLEMNSSQIYSHILVRDVQNKYDYLSVQEKAFLKRLFEGTVERMIELDYVINQFSKVKINKMKPVIRTIMRMSVYQILFMDSVPDSAACNEAVKLAQSKKFGTLKGFVNGVLRNIVRNKGDISYPSKEKEPELYLSVKYSMPEWIIRHFKKQYDFGEMECILEGLLKEHPVSIRMIDIDRTEEILEQLKESGIEATQHSYFKDAYILRGNLESMSSIQTFEEGLFTVQDVSSMLSVQCAGVKKGDYVIDVCAAPGGKTMYAAQLCAPDGKVSARDVSDHKVDLIDENIERCNLDNVFTKVQDARELDEKQVGKADIVIADVPCSGLGVMGKKRDIKYRTTEEALKEIVELQKDIIKTVVKYVKKDGILLYSTCTINVEENEKMVEWISKEYGFSLESLEDFLPESLRSEKNVKAGMIQLLPGYHQTDGFFISRLRKM